MRFINWNNKIIQYSILLVLALVWGSSFILMKRGLRSFSFTQVAAMRIFIAGLVLSPLMWKALPKINRKNVLHLALSGYLGIFFPAFLFTKAQTHLSSSLTGMINSLSPFFALLMGLAFYRTKPGRNQYIGILLGFIGAVGLISSGEPVDTFSNINGYALYVVVATLGYGVNANEVKYKLSELKSLEVTSLSFLLIVPPAALILLFSDFSFAWQSSTLVVDFSYIAILAILGSALSLLMYNNLIKHTSALFATSVTYIIPIFAILWGIFDGEQITARHLLSISLALVGVYLVNTRRNNN